MTGKKNEFSGHYRVDVLKLPTAVDAQDHLPIFCVVWVNYSQVSITSYKTTGAPLLLVKEESVFISDIVTGIHMLMGITNYARLVLFPFVPLSLYLSLSLFLFLSFLYLCSGWNKRCPIDSGIWIFGLQLVALCG